MTTHHTSHRVALVTIGGLLAALSLGGVAQAVTDTIFRYTTVKTGYFGIDAMALAPQNSHAAGQLSSNWDVVAGASVSADGCYNTGVHLPQGATITQLAVYLTGNTGGSYNVALYRHKNTDGTTDRMAFQNLNGNGIRKQFNIAIPNNTIALVSNTGYTYGFGVCMDNTAIFHSARVAYTYTHAGD